MVIQVALESMKAAVAHWPVRQQRPGQQRQHSQHKLGQHPTGADQQPRAAVLHPPGVADVGVEHRQQHHEGQPHALHPTAGAFGHEGVAKLVAELGEGQRDAEGQGATQTEQVREGSQVALPVPRHQEQPEQQDHRQPTPQQPGPVAFQHRPGTVEEAVRPPQRDAEEQVLV